MTSPRRASRSYLFCAALAIFISPRQVWAGAYLSKTAGLVQIKPGRSERWDPVRTVPQAVGPGDSVRTGLRAQATLRFDDGSHVELGPNASFTLEEASGSRSLINLGFGAIKAFVQHLGSRRFQVRTPTAVCSVRGTEFRVEVLSGGRTTVDLYKGLLGVEDHRGQQVLLHPNERLQVDLRGLGMPAALPSQSSIQRSNFHALMQKEMVLDLSKEQVMAAAIGEIKAAEFQQGKSLIDAFGKRVRVEQYIVRPQPNQFKLVVLNERQSSFNYFYYLGTFNQTLPADITIALRQLGGTLDAPPSYWLTDFETARSNTIDSMVEKASGGHPVDVNSNGVPDDKIVSFFDPKTNSFVDTADRSVYQTIFDKDALYLNGTLKTGWTGSNLQSYSSRTDVQTTLVDPFTGAAVNPPGLAGNAVSTFPDASKIHQVITQYFLDGTFLSFDNYIIDDQGKIATQADFSGATSGQAFIQKLLQYNFQTVVSASEFNGRKIDLVVAPKMFVQAGLIQ